MVLRNVPADSTVVGIPGRIVSRRQEERLSPLEHGKLPDVEANIIRSLIGRIEHLEKQLHNLTHNGNE